MLSRREYNAPVTKRIPHKKGHMVLNAEESVGIKTYCHNILLALWKIVRTNLLTIRLYSSMLKGHTSTTVGKNTLVRYRARLKSKHYNGNQYTHHHSHVQLMSDMSDDLRPHDNVN